MLKYLIEKEFKQIRRNSFLPRLILFMPCLTMLILPWAASMEVRNINLAVVDNDRSAYSGRLTEKASASAYFNLVDVASSYEEAMKGVESGQTDIILEIPEKFERRLTTEGAAQVLIAANAVNGTKGGLGSSYLTAIVNDFSADLRNETAAQSRISAAPAVRITPQYKFNPHLNYQVYMVPALMVMLLTIVCGFMPALNIVSEKEIGTIEQINVSPVGKFQFILAKLIPYWVIGFVVLSISFVLAWLVYGLVPAGNLLTIYAGMALYVLTVSGLGLLVSNTSDTMQQAMFVMFFFMIVLILMSGLFTPISSMPGWAQKITLFNPLRYFIQIMRMIYLKGSGFADLLTQFSALAVFTVTINLWAVLSYRKNR
ncbi:Inner membrane transport permease ybhR [Alistipes sp. cv1]|nr:Inner membrane transport permease ybhR [Faecalibacterium prausnitzii]